MKNIYLIDYENVRNNGLKGIESLKPSDSVTLFHYSGEGDVKYETLSKLASSKAFTRVQRISTHTKNAMDFEIVALLGYMVKENGNRARYHIISNDNGYMAAIECIKAIEPQAQVSIESSILSAENELNDRVRELIRNKPNSVVNRVTRILESSRSLSDFHNMLSKQYHQDGQAFYKSLAPLYKEVKAV